MPHRHQHGLEGHEGRQAVLVVLVELGGCGLGFILDCRGVFAS